MAHEELEAKMAENCKLRIFVIWFNLILTIEHVHELNFDVKRKLEGYQDQMAEIESQHKAKVAELESILEEKDGINKQLDGDLATEKTLKELAETTSAGLQKKYEEEKTNWIDSRGKMENKLNKQ